jgi:hypothetical protein
VLIAAEVAAGTALLMVAPTPAGAQLFEDLFPFFRDNRRGGWFGSPEREERAPDYSKAPAPKKTDAVPRMPIMVFGDSMADWLAYGLEQVYDDTAEIGILRRHRTSSGLPPLRSQRAAADIPFLNDLYRSRADKAGIVYVDVWDGFVDEDGRFTPSGPNFEDQTRRLRTGDGVYFTQAGARKLAHFVEREIDRWLSARAVTVALPFEEPKMPEVPAAAALGKTDLSKARPLSGPTVPLIAEAPSESEDLLGGKSRPAVTDAGRTSNCNIGRVISAASSSISFRSCSAAEGDLARRGFRFTRIRKWSALARS